jgi:hypothetical protein
MNKKQTAVWVSPAVFEFLKDPKMSCLFTNLHKRKSKDNPIPIYIETERKVNEQTNT